MVIFMVVVVVVDMVVDAIMVTVMVMVMVIQMTHPPPGRLSGVSSSSGQKRLKIND